MELKLDESGNAVLLDGKPVYVHADGKEAAFDAPATVATISRLNAEAKSHREAKEAAETRLKAFEGIEDGEAARKAIETVRNIKDGELIAAGKVEEIKAAAKKAAEEQVAATNKAHAEELAKLRGEHDALVSRYHGEKIGSAFSGSAFVKDKTLLPPPVAQATFGGNFKVEDGKILAYDAQGNKIFSRSRPGEDANFEEAVEILVETSPYRDQILKGNSGGGGGTRGNGIGAADLSKLSPVERINAVRAGKI